MNVQVKLKDWGPVTVTYCLRSYGLIKENVGHHYISTPTICITSILLPVIPMIKLKVKFKDW